MRILTRIFPIFLFLAGAGFADTITLRDGRTVIGSFLGGDARSIRVAVGDRVETYLLTDVANLSFDGTTNSSTAPASAPPPRVFRPANAPASPSSGADSSTDPNRPQLLRRKPAPQSSSTPATSGVPATPLAPSSPSFPPVSSSPIASTPASREPADNARPTAAGPIDPPASQPSAQLAAPAYTAPRSANQMIPEGAVLTIRMIDPVDSSTDFVGEKYRASLDAAVLDASGNTLVPQGADVVVKLVDDQPSGKLAGHTVLMLGLESLTIDGRDVGIDTSNVNQQSSSRGARSGKVIGGAAALGAIVGTIAGGGKGAASEAGAGTGAEVMTKGQRVRAPSETKLSFTLQQPIRF